MIQSFKQNKEQSLEKSNKNSSEINRPKGITTAEPESVCTDASVWRSSWGLQRKLTPKICLNKPSCAGKKETESLKTTLMPLMSRINGISGSLDTVHTNSHKPKLTHPTHTLGHQCSSTRWPHQFGMKSEAPLHNNLRLVLKGCFFFKQSYKLVLNSF